VKLENCNERAGEELSVRAYTVGKEELSRNLIERG
jgi:hypothetical protein